MNRYLNFRAVAEQHLSSNNAANLYFLIDSAGMPGLHRKLTSAMSWASLFEDTLERNELCVAPTLLLICGTNQMRLPRSFFNWIAEHGTYASSVIMLASHSPINVLKSRLAARLNVRLSGGIEGMLRFYDPRIFEQLITVLSCSQSRIFFSPAEKWWHVSRAGQLGIVHTEFNTHDEFASPLELSEAQEFQLLDASEADQVLVLLRQNAPNLLMRQPLVAQYEFIVRQIQAAKTIGLASTVDFAVYSSTALRYGQDFASTPMWADVLHDAKTRDLSFAHVVSHIDFMDKEAV